GDLSMNSVFATATGSPVGVSAESLARARTTLSQASQNFVDSFDASQSPLKSAASGAPVSVDPEALKVIKRKFADYDDDPAQSPAKRQSADEPDYSSLFRRAGSGKAIKISEGALSAAKRAMGSDENDARENEPEASSFTSPMIAAILSPAAGAGAASAAAALISTTPLRSTPQSSLQGGGRRRLQQSGGGGSQFKSPFNSPFRPPIVASSSGFASPLVAPSAAAAAPAVATPVTATASPLSRMCLNSPASSSSSGAGAKITPIASLNAHSHNFTIRVKVTERTGSIVRYDPKGEGRFCCWLSDASPAASAAAADAAQAADTTPAARLETEAGGATAERAAAELQYGKVYDILSSRLIMRRPALDNPRGLVLFFDEKTQVTEVPCPPSAHARQRHRSSLTPLSDVSKEGEIDLAGIVRAVSVRAPTRSPAVSTTSAATPSPSSTTTASPSSPEFPPSMEVTLVDTRASLTLTLPHEYHKVELKPGDLLLVYRASARLVNGTGVLRVSAVRGRTKLLLNPQTEDGRVAALGRWARSGQWVAAGGSGAKVRSCASIREKMAEGEKGDLVTKAMVSNVDVGAPMTIEECAECGGRILKDTTPCNCAGKAGLVARLQLDVEISDGTGLLRATARGIVAETLVGVETKEALGMLSADGIATSGAACAEECSTSLEYSR
ncbi:hypothetical protein PMAYCL1PPCAC_14719, partial [Pristionchus mayeri]